MQRVVASHRAYTIHDPVCNRVYTITHKNTRPVAVAFNSDIEAIRVARMMETKRGSLSLVVRNWQAPAFHEYCKTNDLDFIYVSLSTAYEAELNARLDAIHQCI
jgi:hypothetical protein